MKRNTPFCVICTTLVLWAMTAIGATDRVAPENTRDFQTIQTVIDSDLIARWTFDEGSGDTLHDNSGNGNHGVIYGGATWVEGYDGGALSFDGSNDYVEIGNIDILPQGEEFTINMWVKFNSIFGDHTILDKRTSAGSEDNVVKVQIQDDYDPDALAFVTCDTTQVCTDLSSPVTNLNTNLWFQVTAVYDNENMRFYINGDLVDEGSASLPLNSTDAPLWLGANYKPGDYNRFEGLLDEMTLYNRALPEDEIQRLDPTLIAYYPFDGHAQDESGNGNHGTIYGAEAISDRCGRANSALHFDGDKVIIDNADILPQGEIFTVSLWAKFDVLTGDHTIFDKREFQSSWENVLNLMIQDSYNPDALSFATFNTIPEPTYAYYSTDNLTVDTWYLITAIYDSTKMSLYVDTTLVDTATASLTLNSTAEELWFGSNDKPYDPNYFLGSLDEIYIFKRALSKGEIIERYMDPCSTQTVAFDIKPQSCPNPLNTKSQGVLPVAILGTAGFDVSDVDPASVRLEGVSPLRWSYEDVAAPPDPGGDVCDCTDQGPDGIMDLALKFRTQEIVAALEPVSDGEVMVLTLTGMTQEGTAIDGQDCVVIIHRDDDKKPHPLGMTGGGIMAEFGSYPNPFNAETEIRFGLLEDFEVSLVVYNILGEVVRALLSADLDAGMHRFHWDGKDSSGNPVASGIYFCRLKTEVAARTMKMIMLR